MGGSASEGGQKQPAERNPASDSMPSPADISTGGSFARCVPLTGASTAGRPLVPQFAAKLGNTAGILPVLDGVGHRRYLTRPNPRTVMKVGFGSHTREVGGHHLFPPLCIRRPSPCRLRLCFVTRHALRKGIRNFCRGLPGELASHRPSPARTIRGPERLAVGRDPKPALAPIPKRQC